MRIKVDKVLGVRNFYFIYFMYRQRDGDFVFTRPLTKKLFPSRMRRFCLKFGQTKRKKKKKKKKCKVKKNGRIRIRNVLLPQP